MGCALVVLSRSGQCAWPVVHASNRCCSADSGAAACLPCAACSEGLHMPKTPWPRLPKHLLFGLVLILTPGVLAYLLLRVGSVGTVVGAGWNTSLIRGMPTSTSSTPTPLPVAARVQAILQADPHAGWDSATQYQTWSASACSPAALTAVLHAWGVSVSLGQVLDRLIAHRAITVQNGLLHAEALVWVAQDLGLDGTTYWHLTLPQVAGLTAQGVPVLVDVVDAHRQTPYPAFAVGHWLVVVSVAADQIAVRDSSAYHIRTLTPRLFEQLFTGIAVVVWQGPSPALP